MAERAVVEATVRLLRTEGYMVTKSHGSNLRSGEPDLYGAVPPWGFMFVAEMKQPGQEPTPQQRARLLEYARRGAIAFAADNPAEVLRTLQTEAARRVEAISLETDHNIPHNAVHFAKGNMLQDD